MSTPEEDSLTKHQEFRLFLFIVVFLFPILSIVLVGGFGFFVWMAQLILGPPSY
ncbi:periplasmic nitrate reductase, NapE protein [Maricurvus nonylphenolicus]|uniref:periplasmic nitrate reductase, NapE protein n=1 Tax=Maricurvus nonylphenolicus TaxID=1008307 RepID=UPI0036F22E0E